MKVLLLNGPPRSGKTTAAAALAEAFPGRCAVIGFSYHLKQFTHGIYLGRSGWDAPPDCFDAIKSEPQSLLGGLSWREMYIHYSERVIKPLHGDEWFGEQFVRAARQTGKDLILVPDSGFREEGARVIREVGAENVRLVRIRREGCGYAGDSRGYIDLSDLGVPPLDATHVTGQPHLLFQALQPVATALLGQ